PLPASTFGRSNLPIWPSAPAIAGLKALVHVARRLRTSCRADNPGRYARDCRLGRHVLKHDASSRHAAAVPNRDVAKHLSAGADHDVVADLRMAIASFLAAAAECDAMEQRAVIADDRSLADDDARRVVEHQS